MIENTNISILLLGECCVGKTSYIIKLINNIFYDDYAGTIGTDFFYTTIKIKKKSYNIYFNDASGDKQFDKIVSSIYDKMDCFIIMYDIQNIESFSMIYYWYEQIHKSLQWRLEQKQFAGSDKYIYNPVILLLGNKFDDDLKERYISYQSAKMYAEDMGMFYDEISVKNNTNINDSFVNFIKKYLKGIKKDDCFIS
jgi:small GTP-binding protein